MFITVNQNTWHCVICNCEIEYFIAVKQFDWTRGMPCLHLHFLCVLNHFWWRRWISYKPVTIAIHSWLWYYGEYQQPHDWNIDVQRCTVTACVTLSCASAPLLYCFHRYFSETLIDWQHRKMPNETKKNNPQWHKLLNNNWLCEWGSPSICALGLPIVHLTTLIWSSGGFQSSRHLVKTLDRAQRQGQDQGHFLIHSL